MSELLFETDGNPAPENPVAGIMTAHHGRRLRYAHFGATGRPLKGTVVVFAGRNECIEKYFETIRDLARRGFGVAMFDWRGQGGSDRLVRGSPRGYIDDFSEHVADFELFFEEVVLPDCRAPFYLLAHSTGALIALYGASELVGRMRRMVLCAPLLEFRNLPFELERARFVMGLLYALGLGRMRIPGSNPRGLPDPFAVNKLTTDHGRYERNAAIYQQHPELATGGPTVAWVHAACKAAIAVQDPYRLSWLKVPSLIVAAGADEVVSTPVIEAFATRLRGVSAITIDGARHEILQEADRYREQFFAAFDAFIPGTEEE